MVAERRAPLTQFFSWNIIFAPICIVTQARISEFKRNRSTTKLFAEKSVPET